MYRAVTLVAREQGIDPGDAERLGRLAESLAVDVAHAGEDGLPRVSVGDRDVTAAIRAPEITAAVSAVSAHRAVRAAMVRRQREVAGTGGVILEGRDIGSVVLPWADVKIYLDASVHVRATRRADELRRSGVEADVADVERDLERRDAFDSSRAESPLIWPIGAWRVDTSELTIDGQVARVIELARAEAARRAAIAALPDRRDRRRLWYSFFADLARLVATVVFGARVRRDYNEVRAENYIYASNHISNQDPPVVSSCIRREVHFVAKAGLFKNPLFGALIRSLNAFPIKRGVFDREAMATSLDLLARGRNLLIFPEGGRVSGGELGAPKNGVGYLAVQSGAPVIPVYLYGSDRLRDCLFRRDRIRVVYGRPIRIPPDLVAGYRSADDKADYRRASEMVMAGIRALKESRELAP